MFVSLIIAAAIAIVATLTFLRVCRLLGERSHRRACREMENVACPKCSVPIGFAAVVAGDDESPWEELWGIGPEFEHCRPVCQKVVCPACREPFVIRLNRQGEQFGSRLSTEAPGS